MPSRFLEAVMFNKRLITDNQAVYADGRDDPAHGRCNHGLQCPPGTDLHLQDLQGQLAAVKTSAANLLKAIETVSYTHLVQAWGRGHPLP